jgi:thermopsin
MSTLARIALIAVVAIAALMVLPGTALTSGLHAGPAAPAPTTTTANSAAPLALNPLQAADQRAAAALTAAGVPHDKQLLPTADPDVTVRNGMVTPGSQVSAAPMGIADYGITEQQSDHANVASVTYTPTVAGVLHLNSMNILYPDSEGPDEFTGQLNAVAVNVPVQNATGLQFWMQNVIYYYGSDHMMDLASAIVNFTGTSFNFPPGTILTGNGFLDPGFGYFNPYGPEIYAPEPFTLALYMNLSLIDHHPTVFFNYSVTSPAGTTGGSYDMVEFNSTITPAQMPAYQINGKALGATGYIPNDVELILGGDGGGSDTNAYGIDGTMNLYIQPNGTSAPEEVPAAFDVGGETGETIQGVAEWASGGANPTVHFGPGPSVQQWLWGTTTAPPFGGRTITLNVTPANAFVFASIGSPFDPNVAEWGAVPTNGIARYTLPMGLYSFEILLSDYKPVTLTGVSSGTFTVALKSDPAKGIYTPLYAWGNAELAAISQGGVGNVSDPYVLDHGPIEPLNPLFGQYNDYMFPTFSGIQLVKTTAYVTIGDEPGFEVAFSLASEQYYSGVLPLDNDLSWFLYGTSHVSAVDNPEIGGWINYAVFGQASLVMWNSSHTLLASNTFPVASLGILEFGGTSNTIWGNVFQTALPIASDDGYILNYGNPVALDLYESGDLVYNNYFGTTQTAFTPEFNPYNGDPAAWTDHWNVAMQPASEVRVVNGWPLSGSILGEPYEGGNYWSNYGTQSDPFGVLPYDNGGNIANGGDHVPLWPVQLYTVRFSESGLPAHTLWSVTLNGITESSRTSNITFWDPNGLYAYSVTGPSKYYPDPSTGAAQVQGSNETVGIAFV